MTQIADSKSKPVLIAYSTRYGSTRTIAGDIQKKLEENKIPTTLVDIRETNIKELGELSGYRGVIVGASVAMFRVHGPARRFLKKLRKPLGQTNIPLVYFVASGTAIKERDTAKEKYIETIVEKTGVRPRLTMAVEPCMNLEGVKAPNLIALSEEFSKQAGKEFNPAGMNDLRDMKVFNKFLDDIVELYV